MKGQWKVNVIGTAFCWCVTAVLVVVAMVQYGAMGAQMVKKFHEDN
jgi:hypothetical protein